MTATLVEIKIDLDNNNIKNYNTKSVYMNIFEVAHFGLCHALLTY